MKITLSMRKKYLVLFLFIAVSLFSQQYPSVNQNHPRLYVSQQRFNFLDSSRTIPPVSTYYNQFTSNYFGWWYNTLNFYLVGSDSTQWTYLFRYFNSNESAYRDDVLYTGLFTAFIYKINHDPVQLKRTRFVINRYISAVDTMNYAGYTGDNLETMLRYFGMLGSALHDWCYYDIDSLTRSRLGSAVYKLNRKFMNSFIYTSGGSSYVSSHNAWNCVLTMQNVLSVYGSDGINPLQHDTVVTWYQNLCDKWTNGFFPVYGYYRSTSGGWNWGAAYSLWSLTDQFTLFENFYNGTDKNYYADLPWVLNSINQYYYFMRPDGICIHLGDGETRIIGDNVIYRHSKIFSDQRSRFLAQKYSVHPLPSTYAYYNVLCYKDFSAPVVSHPQLPLNWLSDRAGLLVSRTSWDSNAVMYWLFNSHSKKAAHEHGDNNTFTVYYKKPLLLDAGFYESYGSPHYTNYYMRTAAHNTVTVFDSTEQFYYSGNLVSNDGGHLISSPMMNYNDIFAPAFQRGRWIAYAHDSTFVYSNTDASLSFNPQKVKRHLRKVIFRKPDKFVILDNVILAVNLSGADREIRWNAHFRNMPQVTGQLVNSEVPGHIEMFNGKKITAVNNPAYITFSTVCPDSTLIRRIGGAGYEFWINGQNYPPSGNPDTNLYNPGKWRTEVVPLVDSDTVNFLHTGFVADA
ncbi:MAG: heparinase II/III-family protein, partial [Ignavibacteria bacterium]|nr:heparinase II/III-family protein [Ignavibacteria bacterium]